MIGRAMAERNRHIIKPPGAYNAVHALAKAQGWKLLDKIKGRLGGPVSYQEIFTARDRSFGVHYIDDDLAGVPFLQTAGPKRDEASEVIRKCLPVYSEDELFALWDNANDMESKMDAILALGVAAEPGPTGEHIRRIGEALTDEDPNVRSAGLVALSYNPPAALKPLVVAIRDGDPDEDSKERARIILEDWKD